MKFFYADRKINYGNYIKIKSLNAKYSDYAIEHYVYDNYSYVLKTYNRNYQTLSWDVTMRVPLNEAYVTLFQIITTLYSIIFY